MSNQDKKFIELNKKLDRMKNDFDRIGESQDLKRMGVRAND